MARELVLLPPDPRLVVGATPIGPGYAKGHTPADMRAWATDVETLYRTAEEDRGLPPASRRLRQWASTPTEQLPPRAQQLMAADRHFFGPDTDKRIEGDLLPDGRVQLAAGQHRAHYLLERGGTPVPVWVADPDEARLEAFRDACHAEVARQRPQLLEPDRTAPLRGLGRIAIEEPRADRSPEVRVSPERLEATRERGVFRGERDG